MREINRKKSPRQAQTTKKKRRPNQKKKNESLFIILLNANGLVQSKTTANQKNSVLNNRSYTQYAFFSLILRRDQRIFQDFRRHPKDVQGDRKVWFRR